MVTPPLVPTGHAYNEERSLWLHRAIAERLRADPAVVLEKARSNLAQARRVHGPSVLPYLRHWDALLDGPLDRLTTVMTSLTQEARDLRQCTPFAGVLSAQERWGVYRAFRRWWEGEVGRA